MTYRKADKHISIHSPHTRGDTSACRRWRCRLISIHSPHTRGDVFNRAFSRHKNISIHSPHTRGDAVASVRPSGATWISIHSPHTRGDKADGLYIISEFISIHSPHTRGDMSVNLRLITHSNFNPLPSHEGRPDLMSYERDLFIFQSTPLTRGETRGRGFRRPDAPVFQSTPLTRGETITAI